MDADDRKLFAASLLTATQRHSGPELDAALLDLGWHDALEGDPQDAVSVLFELQGAANAHSSAIEAVLASKLGVDPQSTPIVLPALRTRNAPGTVTNGRLRVRGLASRRLVAGDWAAVACAGNEGLLAMVPAPELPLQPASGLDPQLGLVPVTAELALDAAKLQPLPGTWATAAGVGQLALAHELIGGARAMLRLAREHALERIQFGHPIAGFQAVRHRLAECLVTIEGARAAADAAWEDPTPLAAAVAKSVAGAGARTVARHCQQVLGGMGFTAEHPLHRYLRRTLVLDNLLGSSRTLTKEIGEQLLASRQLPAVLPL